MSVNGVAYTWDNNGNLTSDGTNSYTYDYANRLVSLTNGVDTYNYAYNGLGDRLQQTVNGVTTTYVLDLNTGLTQVLTDGTDTYLYGMSRIGEEDTAWDYYLGDALGSVRQLTDGTGVVSLAQTFEPYGKVWTSVGMGSSNYAFTGEALDVSGLQYLRARYLDPLVGRFINRDTWGGDYNVPLSLNRWMYTAGNPVNFTDPGGYYRWTSLPYGQWQHQVIEDEIEKIYGGAGGWKIHSEYRVKLPKKEWRRVDLIYFPDAYDQTSAFYPFGNAKGYIYEIEPFDPYEPSGYLIGLGEATWYANLLQVNSFYQFNETGGRTRYNWQDINWEVGSKRIPQDIMFIPINPTGELVVWYEPVGVILYADSRWINDQSDRIKRLPPPVIQKWNDHEDSNLTKEQKQFIAMVNLANKNQPVDEEALLSAGLCDVLILLALQIGKEAVEVAICGPCSLVIP